MRRFEMCLELFEIVGTCLELFLKLFETLLKRCLKGVAICFTHVLKLFKSCLELFLKLLQIVLKLLLNLFEALSVICLKCLRRV